MEQPVYIFDLDGTLIDSRADLTTGINLMRAHYDLSPLPQDAVTGFVGDGMTKLVQRATRDAGVPVVLEDAIRLMREHYAAHLLDQTVLYTGVQDALDMLAADHCHLAIVTNKPTEPARRICRALEIDRYFSRILGSDAFEKRKPDPFPLDRVMADLGSQRAASWMIGDHVTDLEAGQRAGIRRCFCRFGFGRRENQKPDMEVDSLVEFAKHVSTS